jgi:hypothetical protein
MHHHFDFPHIEPYDEAPHLKNLCPTKYENGHKEEQSEKRKSLADQCSFIDKNIVKALESMDAEEINMSLNKFVNLAKPNGEKINEKVNQLENVLENKRLRFPDKDKNTSPPKKQKVLLNYSFFCFILIFSL